jgi:hypothetical protein
VSELSYFFAFSARISLCVIRLRMLCAGAAALAQELRFGFHFSYRISLRSLRAFLFA